LFKKISHRNVFICSYTSLIMEEKESMGIVEIEGFGGEGGFRANTLEKILVNVCTPLGVVCYKAFPFVRYFEIGDFESQPFREEFMWLCRENIAAYEHLIGLKRHYGGNIPQEIREVAGQTVCGKIWLKVAYFRR